MQAQVLGMPLERALVLLRQEGITPRVIRTDAPGDKRTGASTLRVIRVREDELVVSAFCDGDPRFSEDGN